MLLTKHHRSVHLEFSQTNRFNWVVLYVFLFTVQIQWVQCEMQENRGTNRGYSWVVVVSLSEVLCLVAMLGSCTWSVANWMVQVARVSNSASAHPLGYGDNYFFHDDNSACHGVATVQAWKAHHDVRTLRQKSWPKTLGQIWNVTCPGTLQETSLDSR